MRILYDDRELIAQLRAENARLIAQHQILSNQLEALKESFRLLAEKARPQVPQPQPVTVKSIADQLGIPEHMVGMVDLERLGLHLPAERPTLRRP